MPRGTSRLPSLRAVVAGGIGLAAVLVFVAFEVMYSAYTGEVTPVEPGTSAESPEPHSSQLYGRITLTDATVYEGRLRWGGSQEAFWGDYFNGVKDENRWAAHAPKEMLRRTRQREIFGLNAGTEDVPVPLSRSFMCRFGDIARIQLIGNNVRVTVKSGTAFDLDYNSFHDLADGVRVWDARAGAFDIDDRRIQSIDLRPAPRSGQAPDRLYGTVRTKEGEFRGFVQWNRNEGLGTDTLDGQAEGDEVHIRFDTIRSIENRGVGSLVTLRDGKTLSVFESNEAGPNNLGLYVDDARYSRVLVSWEAFERVDFTTAAPGPSYDDYPVGRRLAGRVVTRDGRTLAGPIVYDLDESETTETLDAPSKGVHFTIPFGLVASIVAPPVADSSDPHATVTLHGGETLRLERRGDLGEGNAGLLVFVDSVRPPEYVAWPDVARVEFAPAPPPAATPATAASRYPAHWWAPVSTAGAPEWEILPQSAKRGEVILSKRHELGLLSNFAATPFTFRGRRYASLEGFWQSMLYPEGPEDPRAKSATIVWKHTRDQVAQMTAFEAKAAGDLAEAHMKTLGISWATFEGRRFDYRPASPGEHYRLIVEATRAKIDQNPEAKRVLLSTGDLILKPDHHQEPDAPHAWRYNEIAMKIRADLRRKR